MIQIIDLAVYLKIIKHFWGFPTVVNGIELKVVNFIGKFTLVNSPTERRLPSYSKIDIDLILLSNGSKLYYLDRNMCDYKCVKKKKKNIEIIKKQEK